MIAFSVGVALAIVLAVAGRATKFDRDRSFFATILIVIATYYVLFSFISFEAMAIEIVIASVFSIIALVGALRWPLLLGAGIFLHGVFDLIHVQLIDNSGVPVWWPSFCAGVDVVLGIWVIYLVQVKKTLEHSSDST